MMNYWSTVLIYAIFAPACWPHKYQSAMRRFQVITPLRLFVFGLILTGHVALASLILTGQWQLILISLLLHYLIVTLGISMVYHRAVAHNSVDLPKWIENIGLFLAGMSLQGSAISWVATHRQHHRWQGTAKDPHSPRYLGSWYIHLFGYIFSEIETRHVKKLVSTHHAVWHRYYLWIYLPIFFGASVLLPWQWSAALFWAPVALVFQFENFVNTWTHNWDKDQPVNRPIVSLFVLGEAYHHNHHENPGAPRFHRFDVLGWFLERVIIKQKSLAP